MLITEYFISMIMQNKVILSIKKCLYNKIAAHYVLKSSQAISHVNVELETNFSDLSSISTINVDVMNDYISLIYYISQVHGLLSIYENAHIILRS